MKGVPERMGVLGMFSIFLSVVTISMCFIYAYKTHQIISFRLVGYVWCCTVERMMEP